MLFLQSTFKSKYDGTSRLLNRTAQAADAGAGQHYSPFENLEQIDRERLDSAQHTVDIAMYAFTDRYVAEELLKLSRRGVQIRLYRDRQQYEEEQRDSGTAQSWNDNRNAARRAQHSDSRKRKLRIDASESLRD